jgi:hypothetical protein
MFQILGGVESSRKSLDYLLSTRKAGRIVGIVIGGKFLLILSLLFLKTTTDKK